MNRAISRLDSVILMHNVWICEDSDIHADLTFDELIKAINNGGLMDESLLEACLYCCNMNYENEDIGFHHPFEMEFKKWVKGLIGYDYAFDYDYNNIIPKVKGYEKK